LVEQLIRNQQVTGSSPVVGSRVYPTRKKAAREPDMYLLIHENFIFPSCPRTGNIA
jgi:hypothetical protein